MAPKRLSVGSNTFGHTGADKDQKARIKLSLSADGPPSFGQRDGNEKQLVSLAAASGIKLFNKDGKVIWKAP